MLPVRVDRSPYDLKSLPTSPGGTFGGTVNTLLLRNTRETRALPLNHFFRFSLKTLTQVTFENQSKTTVFTLLDFLFVTSTLYFFKMSSASKKKREAKKAAAVISTGSIVTKPATDLKTSSASLNGSSHPVSNGQTDVTKDALGKKPRDWLM